MITVLLCRNKFVTIRTHSSNSQFMKDFNAFAPNLHAEYLHPTEAAVQRCSSNRCS